MVLVKNIPLVLRKKNIEKKMQEVCATNDVVFLAIFGSFVRGEAKKSSDLDVAIEFDQRKSKNLLDLVHLEYEFEKIFKRKIDLGVYSSINPHIIKDVKKQRRVIYEKR
ncbi:MAG: nucleotidyltransferase domain-containing protein [Elusimicrobia bacterium]|nr:nucleotidyltransferase domain-containing protein [Elusimicrobiota bacterium]